MRNTSDAVIVGGGIIGLAVAFYLAKAKFGNITVVEKEPFLGAGATSKAAGGIRTPADVLRVGEAGAGIIGTSSGVEIVTGKEPKKENEY